MAERRDLTDELHVGQIDDEELRLAISRVLPRGAQFRPDEVEYRTMADDWVLSLQYRDRQIVGAHAGPAMTAELEKEIKSAIREDVLTSGGTKVWRWILFSSPRLVEGYWRYLDEFQICPAPPEAPRARELYAQHPFLLDFKFEDSSNFQVRQSRCIRRASELSLVLNLVLRTHVTYASNRARKHWIWAPEGLSEASIWAQEGYMIPNFAHLTDDIPEPVDIPLLEEVPADTYYDSWMHHPDVLTIPSRLPRMFELFDCLDKQDRRRFLRSCFWYELAASMWDYSQSLYLTCLVNSIECLASVGPERDEREGPSTLFLAFMRAYAPGKPGRNKIDRIYEARSNVTHGEQLLGLDMSSSWALSEASSRDSEVADDATILCRGALLNWLWNHDQENSVPLITKGVRSAKAAKPGTKSGVDIITPESE